LPADEFAAGAVVTFRRQCSAAGSRLQCPAAVLTRFPVALRRIFAGWGIGGAQAKRRDGMGRSETDEIITKNKRL